MKYTSMSLVAATAALAIVASAHAAASAGPKARLFAKYDTNKNGVIDGDEIAVVRKAFAADPHGEFARYDTNKDGKLSDEEIAGIKPPGRKSGGGHRKEGGAKQGDAKESDVKKGGASTTDKPATH